MMADDHASLRGQPARVVRERIRSGAYREQTAGLAPGCLQANLAILEGRLAADFLDFCLLNERPCPLVGITRRGDPAMPGLGDIDIRTDVPSYNVYRDGRLAETVPDISGLWTDGMVAFALGCSFTFERALVEAGVPMAHIAENRTVSMYRTNLPLAPAGPFRGEMVVSMRPVAEADLAVVDAVCDRYPHAHGRPVHAGDPGAIGIADLDRPDWGDPTPFRPGEVPVFWACGVTPQNVLAAARPPVCITHTPGRMLVTDAPEDRMPAFDRRIAEVPALG
jgi:uncharacterized protein YcsI (UPF0317 family)